MLQNKLRGNSKRLVLYTFDLLYLNGYDLRKLPLFEAFRLKGKELIYAGALGTVIVACRPRGARPPLTF